MDKIKGLTIEIGASTKQFENSIKKLKQPIKNTSIELKKINQALKLDPKNTVLLTQKQELLNKRIEQSNNNIKELKTLLKNLENSGIDKTSDQYKNLTIEIEKAKIQHNKFNQELKKFINENSKINKISNQFNNYGNKLNDIAKKTSTISKVSGTVAAALTTSAISASNFADDLLTLSSITHLTTTELQDIKYASELVDVSFETIQNALKKTTGSILQYKQGNKQVIGAFSELGVTLEDSQGNLKNTKQIFYEIIDALKKVENQTQRDVLAQQLLGKSASELNPLIERGSNAFKEFAKENKNLIDKESLENLGEFDDELQKIKVDSKGLFNSIGSDSAAFLLPFLKSLRGIIIELSKGFKNLNPSIKKFIGFLVIVMTALTPVILFLGKISYAISNIIKFLPLLSSGVSKISGLLVGLKNTLLPLFGIFKGLLISIGSFLVANPIILAIVGVIAVFTLLFVKVEGFRNFILSVLEFIKNLFVGAFDFIKNLFVGAFDLFKSVLDGFVNIWNNIWSILFNSFLNVLENIKNAFIGVWNFIISAFNFGGTIFGGIVDGISSIFKAIINGLIGGLNAVVSSPLNFINGILNTIKDINILGITPFSGAFSYNPIPVPQIPYLNVGTNEVLSNGLAYIHKGEQIVPAEVVKGGYNIPNNKEILIEIKNYLDSKEISKKVENIMANKIIKNKYS